MRSPLTKMLPSRSKKPENAFQNDRLPAPLGPSRIAILPFGTPKRHVTKHNVLIEGK